MPPEPLFGAVVEGCPAPGAPDVGVLGGVVDFDVSPRGMTVCFAGSVRAPGTRVFASAAQHAAPTDRPVRSHGDVLPPSRARSLVAGAGKLPAWPPVVFDVVLLGPTHEACRRFLAGAALDARWMRATLPELAWRSVKPV